MLGDAGRNKPADRAAPIRNNLHNRTRFDDSAARGAAQRRVVGIEGRLDAHRLNIACKNFRASLIDARPSLAMSLFGKVNGPIADFGAKELGNRLQEDDTRGQAPIVAIPSGAVVGSFQFWAFQRAILATIRTRSGPLSGSLMGDRIGPVKVRR